MSFNLHNNHPLIDKKQNFLLDRKVVTIHSEDRDMNKYPNANEFSITLPQPVKNVQSMRLLDSVFPADLYVFSNSYQNTKMKVEINDTLHIITITDGNYSVQELCNELKNALNNQTGETGFIVEYSAAEQKFYFANNNGVDFTFSFEDQTEYDNCKSYNTYNKFNRWGLGWNLGFNKTKYSSSKSTEDGYISSWSSNTPWVTNIGPDVYWLKSEKSSNIRSAEIIYMEVEKYNSVDELVPDIYNTSANYYNKNNCIDNSCNTICVGGEKQNKVSQTSSSNYTKSLRNVNSCLNKSLQNDYGGKVNSVFAKIYTRGHSKDVYNEFITDAESGSHRYITTFGNQLEERISKLTFKFRFHDGTPIDFNGKEFNFSIELNQIKSDMLNDMQIRDVYNSYS